MNDLVVIETEGDLLVIEGQDAALFVIDDGAPMFITVGEQGPPGEGGPSIFAFAAAHG